MQHTTTRKFVARAGVALALTFGVLATGVSVAGASDHHHSSWSHDSATSTAVYGSVTAASATSITITERSGTSATFTIASTTTVSEGSAAATAAALAVGEHVLIMPSTTTTGLAASITIRLSHVNGKVSAVSGNNVTVTLRDGLSQTVVVSSATTFTKGGTSATLADVTVGSKICATGLVNTTAKTLSALTVKISTPEVKVAWVVGKVSAINGNNITVALRNGLTLLVVVSSSTTYTVNGASGTLAGVTVGAFIRAAGTVDTTANALDASSVRVGGNDQGQEMSLGLGAKFNLGEGLGASQGNHGGRHDGGRRH